MTEDKRITWLREQITARLEAAKAASPGPWVSYIEGRDHWGGDSFVMTGGEDLYPHVQVGGREYNPNWTADQDFIAANDPQQVITDCEMQLRILDEHPRDWQPGDPLRDCQWDEWPCTTLRHLASAYRHNPGYQEHWGES